MSAPTARELDTEGQEMLASLANLRSEIKGLLALEKDRKEALVKYLDGAEYGTIDGMSVVKLVTVFTERPDYEALKSNPLYAEAIKAHMVSGEYTKVQVL